MKVNPGAATDVGRVRSGNEDSFLVAGPIGLFAVADGMGGHRGGEVASATALESLRASIARGALIDDAIVSANESVIDRADVDPDLRGMGTTITALWIRGDESLIGHVGDSRAYLLRGGTLTQITEDHSFVEELVREGRLTPEQAEVHPQRSIITRALGIDRHVDVDVYRVQLRAGDRVLLCSDGLTSMVRASEIATILQRNSDPNAAAAALVDAANEAGGEDNVTAVIIDVVDGGDDESTDEPVARRLPPKSIPAPEVEPPALPKAPRKRRAGRAAGTALKIALVALPVLLVIALAIGAIGFYARRSYYVTFTDDAVTVYQGVPGGVLGWSPTVATQTELERDNLTPAERLEVEREPRFSSEANALAYVDRLTERVEDRTTTTTTSTTTTMATTTPAPTTTV